MDRGRIMHAEFIDEGNGSIVLSDYSGLPLEDAVNRIITTAQKRGNIAGR